MEYDPDPFRGAWPDYSRWARSVPYVPPAPTRGLNIVGYGDTSGSVQIGTALADTAKYEMVTVGNW